MNYPRLFSPITIKPGFTLKNRIVMPAIQSGFTEDGSVGETLTAYYTARAKGGAALLIVGACRFDETGARSNVLRLASDEDIPMWKEFNAKIHAEDCKTAAQLFHAGRYVASGDNAGHTDALAPSAIYSGFSRSTPKEMTQEDIDSIIAQWAAAAVRAQKADFDAVEIIGSAGYLISQFLSPVTNQRTDAYGGSAENRRRFPLEVIRAVRAAVGTDYPIIFRLSGKDFVPGSNGLEEAKAFAVEAEKAGVDVLNVTGGWHETTVPQLPGDLPRGGLHYLAAGVKSVVSIPVVACNRINSPAVAENILAMEQADLIGMARTLLADPALPNKAKEGKTELIRPCVACNEGCLVGAFFNRPLTCLANPLCGREDKLSDTAPASGKVLVIGGGPAGCEAALRLANRGYIVTLWEKSAHLGGQLRLAALCPAKQEFATLIDYYAAALANAGVTICLNHPATTEAVQKAGFEKVVVAVGGASNAPALPDAVTAEDVLTGKVIPGKHAVIVGGGFKGLETARFLARKSALSPEELFFLITEKAETPETAAQMANQCGRSITVVEQNKKIGAGYEPGVAWTVMQELHRLGVRTKKLTHLTDHRSIDGMVTLETTDKEGNVTTKDIPCDTLISAAGVHADSALADELSALGIQVVTAGNCDKVGRAIQAIYAGAQVGCAF
jgi:2,4-dienoyl-CoA reductase (NADPH2)